MSNTTWGILLVVYMAFWFLAIAMKRHGFEAFFHHTPMTAQELYLTVPFFWGYGIYALQNSSIHWSIRWRLTSLERDDSPVRYWLVVAFYFLYGAFLIVLGLNR